MGIYQSGVEATIHGLQRAANLRAHGLGWVADQMEQMSEPAMSYPGDEHVPVPYAEAMTHDPKGRDLPHLAIRTVLISAHAAGASVTPKVFEDVKRMAMGPEAADTYLDNCGPDREERERRHMVVIGTVGDIVDGRTKSSTESERLFQEEQLVYGGLRYYGNALHTMPEAARQAIGRHAEAMLLASLEKSQANNIKEYAAAAYREASEYGHIWAHTVWARQPAEMAKAFQQYDAWISELLGRMLLFSAGLDLRRDYMNDEISFRPRWFILGRASLMLRSFKNFGAIVGGFRWLRS